MSRTKSQRKFDTSRRFVARLFVCFVVSMNVWCVHHSICVDSCLFGFVGWRGCVRFHFRASVPTVIDPLSKFTFCHWILLWIYVERFVELIDLGSKPAVCGGFGERLTLSHIPPCHFVTCSVHVINFKNNARLMTTAGGDTILIGFESFWFELARLLWKIRCDDKNRTLRFAQLFLDLSPKFAYAEKK